MSICCCCDEASSASSPPPLVVVPPGVSAVGLRRVHSTAPRRTRKKSSPVSPSVMMRAPLAYATSVSASAILASCVSPTCARSLTLRRNSTRPRAPALCRRIASRWKVRMSSDQSTHRSVDRIVAARRAEYSSASSPNDAPGLSYAPTTAPSTTISARPHSRTKKQSPGAPCSMMTVPAVATVRAIRATTCARSFAARWAKT
mmetsp:Transcript_20288/g.81036  ORF Transcript_20288/g.81036 Transcript_20288/m.81036 type:complete len:202 (-) Transcript_20288:415-1020(-)